MKKVNFYLGSYRIVYRIAAGQVILYTLSITNNALFTPIQLFLTKAIVDKFQLSYSGGAYTDVILYTVMLAAFMLVTGLVFGTFSALALSILYDRGDLEKERLIVEKLTRLKLLDAESPLIADMRDKASKVSIVQIFQDGCELLGGLILILVLLTILTIKGHWGFTLGACLVIPFSILIYLKSSEKTEQLARKQTGEKRMTEYLFDILTSKRSVREIRIFNAAGFLKNKKIAIFEKHRKEIINQGVKCESLRLLPEITNPITVGIFAIAIVFLIRGRGGTAGDFLVLFQSVLTLFGTLPRLLTLISNLKASAIRWNDFEEFLNLEEEESSAHIENCEAVSIANTTTLSVEAFGLTFKYPNAAGYAVNNVSMKIPAGCKAAIVGENGSGKSTLVKLLLGLYHPESGYVKWSGGSAEIPAIKARQCTSIVFQDFARINLTIRENVALGSIGLLNDDIKLANALHKAQASEEAKIMDSQLGASFNGLELSGGQWQRLATSRAYLHNGLFVFFDEPTAALDPIAEERAFRTFLEMTRGKSALLVTHRLGAAKLADYILVMKDGVLVEQGSHEELMDSDGEYARMYKVQASWYLQGTEPLQDPKLQDQVVS